MRSSNDTSRNLDRYTKRVRNALMICLLVHTFAPASLSSAQSAVPSSAPLEETRVFEVRIDNKPAGEYRLQLRSNGAETDVQSNCKVDYSVLVFHYRYTYSGRERWSGNKVASLESDCLDGGKHFLISAHQTDDKLALKVNNKTSTISGATGLSSYWSLPVESGKSGSRQFLEVDSGRVFTARFDYVGKEPIKVGDTTQSCSHYRLSGGDEGDVWYDSMNRLVRQSSRDDGHTTVVQLKNILR